MSLSHRFQWVKYQRCCHYTSYRVLNKQNRRLHKILFFKLFSFRRHVCGLVININFNNR